MPIVTGWASPSRGSTLEPFRYPAAELGELDVRVAVSCCGLCYTDVHAIDDYFGITEFPFVPDSATVVSAVTAHGRRSIRYIGTPITNMLPKNGAPAPRPPVTRLAPAAARPAAPVR